MIVSSYLKPLRRKVGVVTLVTACVFSSGWVRSMRCTDSLRIKCGSFSNDEIVSDDGHLLWNHQIINLRQLISPVSWPRISWSVYSFKGLGRIGDEKIAFQIKSLRCGVGYHSATISRDGKIVSVPSNLVFFAPYWPIVIPLTLLSAWLLLSKPRTSMS